MIPNSFIFLCFLLLSPVFFASLKTIYFKVWITFCIIASYELFWNLCYMCSNLTLCKWCEKDLVFNILYFCENLWHSSSYKHGFIIYINCKYIYLHGMWLTHISILYILFLVVAQKNHHLDNIIPQTSALL